MADGFGELMWN